MTVSSSQTPAGREPFDRGAWLLLGFVGVLIALCVAQLVYRFTLITDGWASENDSDECEFLLYENVAGIPSELRPGDALVALNGVPFDPACWTVEAPDGWQEGGSVVYTVRRGDPPQFIDVTAPVTHWTLDDIFGATFGNLAALTGGLGAIGLFFLLGLYTFLNRPATPAARALFMFGSVFFVNGLSQVVPSDLGVRFNLLAFYAMSFFSYAIIGMFFGPTLLTFSLVFPRPKAIVARHAWLAFVPYLFSLVVLAAVYIFNAGAVAFEVTMLLLVAAIVSLVHSGFTMRDAVSRAQFQWSIGGVVVGLGLALVTFLPGISEFSANSRFFGLFFANTFTMGFMLMGVSLSVAILRYRLFDISLVIRRTLTYSLLTLLLAGIYFGGVVILESAFRGVAGGASSLAIVLSTLAIAALFAPLRRRVQGFIDRRFNRRSYDTARTLSTFGGKLRDQVELSTLSDQLLEVVDDTMQPAHLHLWLRQ